MSQRTHVILIDDIDGTDATQTVTFAIDGVTYEIDLNDEHAAALRESLNEWVAKARRIGGRRVPRRRGAPAPTLNQAIREWAREEGIHVPSRGRISAEIREAYDAAHS